MLSKSGYSIQEQAQIYDELLEDVIQNTRWYLDNYEYMREFRVSWISYKTQKITKPYKFVNAENGVKPKAL